MVSRIILSCMLVAVASILSFACSGRAENPMTPNSQENISESELLFDKSLSGTAAFGSFDFIIDSTSLNIRNFSARRAAEIGDSWELEIDQYLQSYPCGNCLKIDNIGLNDEGQIEMIVGIKHPYPADAGRLDLDVLDVRLILIADGTDEFSQTVVDGNPIVGNFELVANPDGYTTHYDDGSEGAYAGNLNPYIDFFTEDDPSPDGIGKEIKNHRMAMGSDYDYKRIILNIPPGESIPIRMTVEASYGHSAKRSIPEGEPGSRTNPLYYIPEFNRKEAYSLKTSLEKIIYGDDPAAIIDLEVLDWQAGAHVSASYPMSIQEIQGPSGVKSSSLEIPFLNYFSSSPYSQTGQGTPQEPLHIKYRVPMSAMSIYPLLARVQDHRDDTDTELDISTYQHDVINTFIRIGDNKSLQKIYTSAYDSVLGQKSIAVDENRIYVVWSDVQNATGIVFCSRSINGGLSFEAPVKVSDNSRDDTKLRPSVAVDDAHTVYVVWEDYGNLNPFSDAPDIYLSKSNNYGYSFGQDIRVNDAEDLSDDAQTYPMIATRGTGKIYITWLEKPTGTSQRHIRLARSIDGGATFLPEVKVSSDVLRTGEPSLGVSPSGIVWVAWRDYRNDQQDIFASCSTNDGQTFGPEIKVNDDSGCEFQTSPSIAVDDDGVAYIVWQDSRDPGRNDFDIYFAYSINNNGFSPNKRINRIENVALTPKIALAKGGGIFVVYRDTRDDPGGDIYVTGSLDKGKTFSLHHDVKVNDDSDPSIQLSPQIAVSGDGKLHIVWGDGRGYNPTIYYAQSIFP